MGLGGLVLFLLGGREARLLARGALRRLLVRRALGRVPGRDALLRVLVRSVLGQRRPRSASGRVVVGEALGGEREAPIGRAILAGSVAVILYPLCFYSAMHVGGVALGVTTTIGSSPVAAAAFERILTGEPLPRGPLVGGAAAVVGTALLGGASIGLGDRSPSAILTGVGLGLLAGSCYGAYSVAGARAIRSGVSSGATMGAMFGLASVPLLVAAASAPEVVLALRGVAVIGYLALVPMAAGYVLFGRGLRSTSATAATTLSLAEPVVAALLARAVAHQQVSGFGWLGIAVVTAGVVVTARRSTAPVAPPARSRRP
jgi:DME family drug/metabolite transporter